MINEEQVRDITKKVLDEEHLTGFIKIFEKEHNLFRGSHEKIGLPENLEIPEKIITQIIKYVSATFKELEDTDIPEHLTGDFIQYDEGIEKWKRMPALTQGSILFAGENGYFTEDADNLFWDDTLKVLEVLCPTTPVSYGNIYIGKGVIGAGNSVGTRNVILGYEAGYNNTSGYQDTFLGYYAGRSNTSAYKGTLIGAKSGYYITTSPSNTCLGYMSGITITTGDGKNVCIGEFADAGTTGKENVSVGYNSLSALWDGFRNTCIGYASNVWDGDSQYRIAIGYNAISKEDNLCAIGGLSATDSVNLAIFYNREFRFYDDGNNYVGFKAPALSADQIWVLPTADGVANQPWGSDGGGTLQWLTTLAGLTNIKTGATQVGAGAVAGELWATNGHGSLPDNVLMIGV